MEDGGSAHRLDDLSAAILHALAEATSTGMSLPRLGKRLGLGASVLMRQLSLMGEARVGGIDGLGWVRVTPFDGRWVAALTEAGRSFCAAGLQAREADSPPDDLGTTACSRLLR